MIEDYTVELCEADCFPGAALYSARVLVENDVSAVMPYLNAVLPRAQFGGEGTYIVWKEGERKYALRPHELAISQIFERRQADELARQAVAKINDVWARRVEITPNHEKRTPPGPLEVYKLLPRTNCGECGLATCMAFAAGMIEGEKSVEDCPDLLKEEYSEQAESLREMGL